MNPVQELNFSAWLQHIVNSRDPFKKVEIPYMNKIFREMGNQAAWNDLDALKKLQAKIENLLIIDSHRPDVKSLLNQIKKFSAKLKSESPLSLELKKATELFKSQLLKDKIELIKLNWPASS